MNNRGSSSLPTLPRSWRASSVWCRCLKRSHHNHLHYLRLSSQFHVVFERSTAATPYINGDRFSVHAMRCGVGMQTPPKSRVTVWRNSTRSNTDNLIGHHQQSSHALQFTPYLFRSVPACLAWFWRAAESRPTRFPATSAQARVFDSFPSRGHSVTGRQTILSYFKHASPDC